MDMKKQMDINGIEFSWNLEEGQLIFEQQDSVLFWISSAMKSFFDTIEEISGTEASKLVFETTGFRQGITVGEYFEKKKNVSIEEASKLITNTYASAGWGHAVIEELDIESKTFTVKFKNSWEYKIHKAQGKSAGAKYIPAHYAGIFTAMLGTNIWYEIIQDQIEGHEYSVVRYFQSDITVNHNIRQLAKKTETDHILELEALVEDKTRDLTELVKELSSPIIPVLEGIVVVPLIGKYDEERAISIVEKTLTNLPSHKASYLILDLTGLHQNISQYTARLIENIASATSLIGIKTVLVGISPQLSMVIIQSDVQLSKFDCFKTLQHGIHYALGQMGKRIV
ncbi:anti-anti-sigma regulatory factor [Psychrobacillus insolitus]|uniref:Anti-anti-sigma regulatory factor n=1 Tax=Psychrobacillus insolitus TaxID=1461 RepID=A0A2W7MNT5_9BACI|nr:STAS domain-containing protein [Psychrobacillus insolitus]PZX03943.1 anti-anti-sigma regulatory factor [Psychrobacillus insolitus]